MKWILCGKNNAAVAALEHLLERGDEVWAIGVAGDTGRDDWQRSFRNAAEAAGVRFVRPRRIGDPEFVERLREFGARALISIQYDQILRAPLFERIGCPCLNLHFSLLPRHRGVAPVPWAILEGDDEAGVTLHQMVEDIDAGDVVGRAAVPIGATTTARELYDAVERAATRLFRTSYPFSDSLLSTRLEQDESVACYHRRGDLDFSRRRIDWSEAASRLHRWIRAMTFPPLQRPEFVADGRALAVGRLSAAIGPATGAAPGTVLASGPDGLTIAASDGVLTVTELLDEADPNEPSANLVRRFEVGATLG